MDAEPESLGAVVEVVAPDGARFALYGLERPDSDRPGGPAPVVLVSPAMGTPARFYAPLVRELHAAGLVAVTLEERGQGERRPAPGERASFGYAELVGDLDAAVRALRERFPGVPLAVLGHSLGGQLALLQAARGAAEGSPVPDAVAVVAAGSVWYRSFGAVRGIGVLAGSQCVALLATVLGRWPGHRLGFGGRQPARVMRDWARQSRTGRYELGGSSNGTAADRAAGTSAAYAIDYEAALAKLALPVLAVGVAGDRLAPPGAMRHLCGKVPHARLERWRYTAVQAGGRRLDHFRWVRHGGALAAYVADWMDRAA